MSPPVTSPIAYIPLSEVSNVAGSTSIAPLIVLIPKFSNPKSLDNFSLPIEIKQKSDSYSNFSASSISLAGTEVEQVMAFTEDPVFSTDNTF